MLFTEQENIVLSIVAEGAPIMALGHWEGQVLTLAERGLLRQSGHQYVITPAGREAFEAVERHEFAGMAEARKSARGAIEGEAEECPSH